MGDMTKPDIYMPIAHPLYLFSARPVAKKFEENGHKCCATYDGQPIMIGSDAGDGSAARFKYNLNHGFGSKNTYWGASCADREKRAVQLVPSQWYAEQLHKYGVETIVTGMPRLDEACGLRQSDKHIALYAPTCHVDVTSVRIVQKKIYDIDGFTPMVRYHPQLQVQVPEVKEWYPDWISDREVGELVAEASVVICDYATTALDAIVLGRPVIVIENPQYRHSCYYSPNNAEIVFSGAFYKATSWEDVLGHLWNLRLGHDPLKDGREILARDICWYRGEAAQRVYDVVMERWHR